MNNHLIFLLSILLILLSLSLKAISGKHSAQEQCPQISNPDNSLPLPLWFFQEGEKLKYHGCWTLHRELGFQVIRTIKQPEEAELAMNISLQMASSSFYLGDYHQALDLARQGYMEALRLRKPAQQVEGLYLQSAAERALNGEKSLALAREALDRFKQLNIRDNRLLGKVHYNLGAALSEITLSKNKNSRLSESRKHLETAKQLFQIEKSQYDTVRTELRLARLEYQSGDYLKAESMMSTIEYELDNPRIYWLYYYQLAKVQHRLNRWTLARKNAEKAMQSATEHRARGDQHRIRLLLQAINKKEYLAE